MLPLNVGYIPFRMVNNFQPSFVSTLIPVENSFALSPVTIDERIIKPCFRNIIYFLIDTVDGDSIVKRHASVGWDIIKTEFSRYQITVVLWIDGKNGVSGLGKEEIVQDHSLLNQRLGKVFENLSFEVKEGRKLLIQ